MSSAQFPPGFSGSIPQSQPAQSAPAGPPVPLGAMSAPDAAPGDEEFADFLDTSWADDPEYSGPQYTAGIYPVIVRDVALRRGANGKPSMQITFEFDGGPYAGKSINAFIHDPKVTEKSEGKKFLGSRFKAFFAAVGRGDQLGAGKPRLNVRSVVNERLRIRVKAGKDQDGAPRCEVSGYLPADTGSGSAPFAAPGSVPSAFPPR